MLRGDTLRFLVRRVAAHICPSAWGEWGILFTHDGSRDGKCIGRKSSQRGQGDIYKYAEGHDKDTLMQLLTLHTLCVLPGTPESYYTCN